MAELTTQYNNHVKQLQAQQGQAAALQEQIVQLEQLGLRHGNETYDQVLAQLGNLNDQIGTTQNSIGLVKSQIDETQTDLLRQEDVEAIAQNLTGDVPIVMFPMRVETRFMEVMGQVQHDHVSAVFDKLLVDTKYFNDLIYRVAEDPILKNPADIEHEFSLLGEYLNEVSELPAAATEISTVERPGMQEKLNELKSTFSSAEQRIVRAEGLEGEAMEMYLNALGQMSVTHSHTMARLQPLDQWQVADHLRDPKVGEEGSEAYQERKNQYLHELHEAMIMAERDLNEYRPEGEPPREGDAAKEDGTKGESGKDEGLKEEGGKEEGETPKGKEEGASAEESKPGKGEVFEEDQPDQDGSDGKDDPRDPPQEDGEPSDPEYDRLLEMFNWKTLLFTTYQNALEWSAWTVTSNELWVRVFPDDISVHTHEELLTDSELEAAEAYWNDLWPHIGATGPVFEEAQLGAWRVLVNRFGQARAAYVVKASKPSNYNSAPSGSPNISLTTKADSWVNQPVSKIMPDQFVVTLYDDTAPAAEQDTVPNYPQVKPPGSGKQEVAFTPIYRGIGNVLPTPHLPVGIDPATGTADQFEHDANGDLKFDPTIKWMFDFDDAVAKGMAIKIALDPERMNPTSGPGGFDRLSVIGVRVSTTEAQTTDILEDLFENHRFTGYGMEFLEQGTPTNNTEDAKSHFSAFDRDPVISRRLELTEGGIITTNASTPHADKQNGTRMAEALGVSTDTFTHIARADENDLRDSILMNRALWMSTLGLYLEDQAGPTFPLKAIRDTRAFFVRWVAGRGLLSPMRIGTNPYGVLPTTAFSKMTFSSENHDQAVASVLKKLDMRWEYMRKSFVRTVMDEAQAEDYPHLETGASSLMVHQQQFLDILGLLSRSVEVQQRYAAAVQTIQQSFGGNAAPPPPPLEQELQGGIRSLLHGLFNNVPSGYRNTLVDVWDVLNDNPDFEPVIQPRIWDAGWLAASKLIYGPIIDPYKPSKDRLMANHEGQNYIDALLNSYVKELHYYNYDGCLREPPLALLYHMLRQSLLMSYWDASMQIYTNYHLADAGTEESVRRAYNLHPRLTYPNEDTNPLYTLFGMQPSSGDAEHLTRFEFLYQTVDQPVTGMAQGSTFADFIIDPASKTNFPISTAQLQDMQEAMVLLKDLSTHRLYNAFHEHLDLCSYRLDAWWLGLAAKRLTEQRAVNGNHSHIGAFAWVENLRPGGDRPAVPAHKIPGHFQQGSTGPLEYDEDNQGFVHAPSIAHANTAAILRSGYFANAASETGDSNQMAINLSSERVRLAMHYIGGIRHGQRLSALLGYQFERALHDRHSASVELDKYIYVLRKHFPLQADQLSTSGSEPIDKIEARNVVDGLAFLDYVEDNGGLTAYPWGLATGTGQLPVSGSTDAQIIEQEVSRMANAVDAVADLALAESVYQVNIGNFHRAAAVVNAIMEGTHPQEPDILRTPREGNSVTHRTGVMLSSTANPWSGISMTARALAEPALNNWLGGLLGNPDNIRVVVNVDETGFGPTEISISDLNLQPIDLIYIIGEELSPDASELSQRIAFAVLEETSMPQNARIEIQYAERDIAWGPEVKSIFEMAPLVGNLARMVNASRALHQKDIVVPGSETSESNPNGIALAELQSRVNTAYTTLDGLLTQLENQVGTGLTPNAAATRNILLQIAEYGIGSAIPGTASGSSAEVLDLLDQAGDVVVSTIRKRLAAADALINQTNTGESITAQAERYQNAAKALFGSKFLVLPKFNIETGTNDYQAQLTFADNNSGQLLAHADAYAMDDWLHGVARVRTRMKHYEQVLLMAETFDHSTPDLRPIQLPFTMGDPWLGIERPDVTGVPEIEGDRLSLVMHFASGYSFSSACCGLLLDEWVETIPTRNVDSGITFFYDQPDSEAPNCVLIAINPEDSAGWTWENLEQTLMETFTLAQKRAVEPDHIAKTWLSQAFPAVVSELRMNGKNTIDTDYAWPNYDPQQNPQPTLFDPYELGTGEEGSTKRQGCPPPDQVPHEYEHAQVDRRTVISPIKDQKSANIGTKHI